MTVIPGGALAEAVKFAGTDLKSLGLYCEVDEGVYSSPPVRGSNLLIPYTTGKRWAQKFYDERPVVLTGSFLSTVSRLDFQTNLDRLKQVFQLGTGEQKLEVQWQDGSYRYVMADVVNTLGLQRLVWPPKQTPFSIELLASDPLWYGSDLEASVLRGTWAFDSGVMFDDRAHWFDSMGGLYFAQTLATDPATVVATNGGNHWTRKPVFTMVGAATNPKITNSTNGFSVQVLETMGAGDTLIIDCAQQIAYRNGVPVVSGHIVIGSSQVDWMHIEPGSNTLSIALNQVTPSVAYSAQFSPAWL